MEAISYNNPHFPTQGGEEERHLCHDTSTAAAQSGGPPTAFASWRLPSWPLAPWPPLEQQGGSRETADAPAGIVSPEEALLDVIDAVISATSTANAGWGPSAGSGAREGGLEDSPLAMLMEAGLLPVLGAAINPSILGHGTTLAADSHVIKQAMRQQSLALEACCCLLSSEMVQWEADLARWVVPNLIAVLQQYIVHHEMNSRYQDDAAGEVQGQVPDQLMRAASVPLYQDTATPPTWLPRSNSSNSSITLVSNAPPSDSIRMRRKIEDGCEAAFAASTAHWGEVGLTIASCLVRITKFAQPSKALVKARVVPILARMVRFSPENIKQVAMLGLYKLANPPHHHALLVPPSSEQQATLESLTSQTSDLADSVSQHEIVLRQLLLSGAVPELCLALSGTLASSDPQIPDQANQNKTNSVTNAVPDEEQGRSSQGAPSNPPPWDMTGNGDPSSTDNLLARCLPDVIGALLVDMAGLQGLPELFASRDLVRHVVQLLDVGNPQVG